MAELHSHVNFAGLLQLGPFVTDQKILVGPLNQLRQIERVLTKCANVISPSSTPQTLIDSFDVIARSYSGLVKDFIYVSEGNKLDQQGKLIERINNMHTQFFEISSSNRQFQIVTSILNSEREDPLDKAAWLGSLNDVRTDLELKKRQADDLLEMLRKPAEDRVLSKYSEIYNSLSIKHGSISANWVWAGIGMVITFIAYIIVSNLCDWFPYTITLKDIVDGRETTRQIIHYPMLATKILLASVFIYLITFCFKQFVVNKHLQVLNTNRARALESYTLFDAAMGNQDMPAKKELLSALAKSIYSTINSGYLNSTDKETTVFSQVLDLKGKGE